MYNYIINLRNSQKFTKILLFLLVLSIFIPIRNVFLSSQSYLTGDYSDFTSISLYLSDILLFTTWFLLILPRGRASHHVGRPIKLLILWVFLGFLINFGLYKGLNTYFLFKWLELIVAYETFRLIFRETGLKMSFFKLFAWFCGIQSVLAIIQFCTQTSVGIYKLGESHLSPLILGVAKIVSGGTTYIRGYGTFPHPNALSAFLVVGILISIYLLLNSAKTRSKITYATILFVNTLGLTVTFSRGAYLALALGLIIFFGFLFSSRGESSKEDSPLAKLLIFSLLSIAVSFLIFKPFLISRAEFSDSSFIERKFYNETGLKMAKNNPIFGVGMGESVLHMEQYSGLRLEPWEKQPPHNYFIIAAAELGIGGALILLWIFLSHFWGLIKKIKSEVNPGLVTFHLLLVTVLATFLLLMQFDHYFYTLQQTQLLLWMILGIISAEMNEKQ